MRARLAVIAVAVAVFSAVGLTVAYAGSPHFVDDTVTATRVGDTLTVSGKEAGLGDEPQVHVVVTATASCVNPGGNKPQAANKQTVSAEGDFPVQSGHAEFSLTLAPVFQPSCSPPMQIEFSDVVVTDQTSGISVAVPGTF